MKQSLTVQDDNTPPQVLVGNPQQLLLTDSRHTDGCAVSIMYNTADACTHTVYSRRCVSASLRTLDDIQMDVCGRAFSHACSHLAVCSAVTTSREHAHTVYGNFDCFFLMFAQIIHNIKQETNRWAAIPWILGKRINRDDSPKVAEHQALLGYRSAASESSYKLSMPCDCMNDAMWLSFWLFRASFLEIRNDAIQEEW